MKLTECTQAVGRDGAPVMGPLWLLTVQPPTRTPLPPSSTSPPAALTAAGGRRERRGAGHVVSSASSPRIGSWC